MEDVTRGTLDGTFTCMKKKLHQHYQVNYCLYVIDQGAYLAYHFAVIRSFHSKCFITGYPTSQLSLCGRSSTIRIDD